MLSCVLHGIFVSIKQWHCHFYVSARMQMRFINQLFNPWHFSENTWSRRIN